MPTMKPQDSEDHRDLSRLKINLGFLGGEFAPRELSRATGTP